MPKVTKIPATLARYTAMPISAPRKRRVAAYARVSTDHEEQLTSYEAQVDYYTNFIKGHADWAVSYTQLDVYKRQGVCRANHTDCESFLITEPAPPTSAL